MVFNLRTLLSLILYIANVEQLTKKRTDFLSKCYEFLGKFLGKFFRQKGDFCDEMGFF